MYAYIWVPHVYMYPVLCILSLKKNKKIFYYYYTSNVPQSNSEVTTMVASCMYVHMYVCMYVVHMGTHIYMYRVYAYCVHTFYIYGSLPTEYTSSTTAFRL